MFHIFVQGQTPIKAINLGPLVPRIGDIFLITFSITFIMNFKKYQKRVHHLFNDNENIEK